MKNKKTAGTTLLILTLMLSACETPYPPTMRPDYTIRVTPSAQGGTAIPPTCPSWSAERANPYDNQPLPQYGCTDARNLAAMVETPNDLVRPRELGPMRGVAAVGAMRRYDNNQQRGLIVPGAESNQVAITTASTSASQLSGDITAGAPGAAPSTASSAASP